MRGGRLVAVLLVLVMVGIATAMAATSDMVSKNEAKISGEEIHSKNLNNR